MVTILIYRTSVCGSYIPSPSVELLLGTVSSMEIFSRQQDMVTDAKGSFIGNTFYERKFPPGSLVS